MKNAAEIAEREGLTRARVSQLMRLLRLAPEILADIEDAEGAGPVPTEARLRKLAGLKTPERQIAQYRRLCAAEAEARRARSGRKPKAAPPRRGLQHLFERARRYHAMLESGKARSLEEIGRAEGVTGARIRQIVQLLHLAPEIVSAVDVPAEDLPAGVSERTLRKLGRMRTWEEQRAAWGADAPSSRCSAMPKDLDS